MTCVFCSVVIVRYKLYVHLFGGIEMLESVISAFLAFGSPCLVSLEIDHPSEQQQNLHVGISFVRE